MYTIVVKCVPDIETRKLVVVQQKRSLVAKAHSGQKNLNFLRTNQKILKFISFGNRFGKNMLKAIVT